MLTTSSRLLPQPAAQVRLALARRTRLRAGTERLGRFGSSDDVMTTRREPVTQGRPSWWTRTRSDARRSRRTPSHCARASLATRCAARLVAPVAQYGTERRAGAVYSSAAAVSPLGRGVLGLRCPCLCSTRPLRIAGILRRARAAASRDDGACGVTYAVAGTRQLILTGDYMLPVRLVQSACSFSAGTSLAALTHHQEHMRTGKAE
jgi:hypothetical protein